MQKNATFKLTRNVRMGTGEIIYLFLINLLFCSFFVFGLRKKEQNLA